MQSDKNSKGQDLYTKGQTAYRQGQLRSAGNYFQNALEMDSDHVPSLRGLAETCFQQKDLRQSEQYFRAAIALDSQSAGLLSNFAYLLYLLGNLNEAEEVVHNAISLKADNPGAQCNLGIILMAMKRQKEAQEIFLEITRQNPEMVQGWTNLAILHMNSGKLTESVNASRKAIQLNPRMVESYCNLGMALQESMQLDQALVAYNNALMLQPQHPAAQSNRLMCMQYEMKFGSKELREAAAGFDLGIGPMEAQAPKSPRRGKKIRIGYVSADFNRHPIGWFFQEILRKQDRETFETFCYYAGYQNDGITDTLRQEGDHWYSIHNLTDREVAARIQSDRIDILVDLGGHTAGNRLGIFQYRPAPIQISWLGYFASTGLNTIDYVFMSRDQIAAGSQKYFSEKLFLLEQCQFCYSPPDYSPPVAPSPHLQNGFIRFACFNNTAKLNSDLLSLWCQILRDVPGSRLLLKWKSFFDNTFSATVRGYCQRAGIDSDRIELRGASDHKTMLDEYSDVDIALDPFPFSGALTTCESLWMGVPVVSMAQLRPVSRQSFSILKNIGMEELTASSADEYRSIAVSLAGDSQKLSLLRRTLRQNMSRKRDSHAAKLTIELERGFCMIKKKS